MMQLLAMLFVLWLALLHCNKKMLVKGIEDIREA